MTNKYIISVIAFVMVLVVGMVGYGVYINATSNAHMAKMAAAQYAQVKAEAAGYREITPTIYFSSANLRSDWMLDLRAKVDGTITNLFVKPGDRIRSGQLIAEIANEELPSDILQADSKIQEAKVNYVKYDQNVRRYQELVTVGGVSRQQLDEALANREAAAAQVASSQAYREQLTKRLGNQQVVADRDCDILKVYHYAGSVITTGQALVMVGDFDNLFIRTEMRQDMIDQLLPLDGEFRFATKNNQPLDRAYESDFRADTAAAGGSFAVTVAQVDPPLTNTSEYRTILWRVDNKAAILEPGTYHQVKIHAVKPKRLLTIPQNALNRGSNLTVYVVNAAGKLEQRTIKTGTQDDRYVEVISGVKDNELVVVSGHVGLKPGMAVHVVGEGE